MNLLGDGLIRVGLAEGPALLSLPETYVALGRDEVVEFPNLRAHQRHPLHSLLVNLGALASLKLGRVPDTAQDWTQGLRALTPGFADDAPWRLISPLDQPAFLQPVTGTAQVLKNSIVTPDALDMLVIARNHDLKTSRMRMAQPDDWLFALVTLQTAEGYLGAGNYGISRMNGAYANRACVGLAPPGGVGAHVMRDIGQLIALRDTFLNDYEFYEEDGPALLWLLPWDGTHSLSRQGLDPYYIEICRRVRLVESGGVISARGVGSKGKRVAMTQLEGGITGDPWSPIDERTEEPKVLTIDARGFDYRRLADIMFGRGYKPAPLQESGKTETGEGWSLICRALARGKSKTEGYHERRVPMPGKILGRISEAEGRANLGQLSQGRIKEAGAVRTALRYGLMMLLQNGPDEFKAQDPSSARQAEPFLARFQEGIDTEFFADLFAEAMGQQTRAEWLEKLFWQASALIWAAMGETPGSVGRKFKALVRADDALRRSFFGNPDLRPYGVRTSMTRERIPQSLPALDHRITALAGQIIALHMAEQRGPLAELRRMDADDAPIGVALQRILAAVCPQADLWEAKRIALLVKILALPRKPESLEAGRNKLGQRLKTKNISEARMQRLMSTEGEPLDEQIMRLARQVGEPLPYLEFGRLLLGDAEVVEFTRYAIARGYWTKAKSAADEDEPGTDAQAGNPTDAAPEPLAAGAPS